jgi:2-keto-3-deoxy-L-rhamnonate aldolase RhmA
MKQPNRVKAAVRAGRKACGYNLSFPSPWVIDILGKLDFDFVFIDGEHGPFGLDQLEDLCRTAERHNVTTIARVPDIGSSTILRYLDRRIMGILGPHIATEADARQLVRACYFGPLGERSFGANRGTDYNAGIADKAAYYREANEQMLVCALLEDVAVLDNLDAILSVPGIDLALIMAGEVGARAVITRIEGRIEDWKAGRFPSPANPQSWSSSSRIFRTGNRCRFQRLGC